MTLRMLSRLVSASCLATVAGFEFRQLERNLFGKIAKFVPCHVHQFGNRPDKHRFLHRLTAPIAAF
jgi:hypothetical protein